MQTPTLTDKLRSVIRRVTVSNSLIKKPQRIWKRTTLSTNFQINSGFQLSTFLRHYLKKKKIPFNGRILHLRWFKLSTSFFSMLRQYSAWHKKEAFCTTKVNFVAVRIHFDEAVLYVKNGLKPTFTLRSHALFFFLGNTWF